MRGRTPKPRELRQRRNREPTHATLPMDENTDNKVPALPTREKKAERWHPMVVAWWSAIWRSPMASEFLDSDKKGGLYLLAELHQRRWTADDSGDLVNIAKEIRQQEVRFGLSPIDRRRLQWEVEKGEQATDRTARRRQTKEASAKDPRDVLKVVQGQA